MKDLQNQRDYRNIPIDKVGIKNLRYPITVRDRREGFQHTVAVINMYVDLPHKNRGTHMSRFVEMLHMLQSVNDPILQAGLSDEEPDREGWYTIILHFEDFWPARKRIMGFGGAVEVLEPEALRLSVLDFANQTIKVYNR